MQRLPLVDSSRRLYGERAQSFVVGLLKKVHLTVVFVSRYWLGLYMLCHSIAIQSKITLMYYNVFLADCFIASYSKMRMLICDSVRLLLALYIHGSICFKMVVITGKAVPLPTAKESFHFQLCFALLICSVGIVMGFEVRCPPWAWNLFNRWF